MPVSILRNGLPHKKPSFTRRGKRVIFSLDQNRIRIIPRRKTRKSSS